MSNWLDTQEILKRFRKFKLTRGKLFYIEQFGTITKEQRVENGKLKNYYHPEQIEACLLRQQRKRRAKPLTRFIKTKVAA